MTTVSIATASCIGCGSCAALCPEIFAMNDQGTAEICGEATPQMLSDLKDAVRMCPADCIYIDA